MPDSHEYLPPKDTIPKNQEPEQLESEQSDAETAGVTNSPNVGPPPKLPHLKIPDLFGEKLAGYGWVATPKPLVRNWRLLKGLNSGDVLLLILLLDYRSSDGSYKPAAVRALASQMDMGERALRKKIKKLKELGYIIQSGEIGCKRTYDLGPLFPKLLEAQQKYIGSREKKV